MAKLSISPTTTAIAVNTNALALSSQVRRGTAWRLVRIMPVLYSEVTTSTARTETASWPNNRLKKATRVGSNVSRSDRLACL